MTILRILLLAIAVTLGTAVRAQPAEAPDPFVDALKAIADGRSDDAEEALQRMMEQEPQQAGAWLDLAVIQCELGHAKEAERLFHVIEERYAPPAGIIEIINSHRATGCRGKMRRDRISVLLGRGYDTNVNQGASDPLFSLGTGGNTQLLQLLPEYLPRHDEYTLLSASYVHDFDQRGDTGYLQFQARDNDTLSPYNTMSLLAGFDSPWRLGTWNLHSIANGGLLTLAGRQYQRQFQLQERFIPPWNLSEHFQLNFLAGLSYVQYPTLINFDTTTDELDVNLLYLNKDTAAQMTVGGMFDHGDAQRLGGDRRGWQASGLLNHRFNEHLSSEFGLSWQRWDSDSAYSPGLIDQIREENSLTMRAGLIVPVAKNTSIEFEWRRIRNNENISLFEYRGQLLQLSLKWQNF